jgi:signal transduction histidine kinase
VVASEAADGAGLDPTDLRTHLTGLATAAVHIAVPAEPVALPAHHALELAAAVSGALDNVHRHAGPAARAWILLEDERDAVRVSIRDDGPGIAEGRLVEAAAAGRLGVAQSIRGRVNDLGVRSTSRAALARVPRWRSVFLDQSAGEPSRIRS